MEGEKRTRTDYTIQDPNPGIEPRFPALQADSLPAEPKIHVLSIIIKIIPKLSQKNRPTLSSLIIFL